MGAQFCGIDFGTSNSTVALADASGARLIALEGTAVTLPSAVFWEPGAPQLYGRAAIAAYLEEASYRRAVAQYIAILAGQSGVSGVAIAGAEGAMVQ